MMRQIHTCSTLAYPLLKLGPKIFSYPKHGVCNKNAEVSKSIGKTLNVVGVKASPFLSPMIDIMEGEKRREKQEINN